MKPKHTLAPILSAAAFAALACSLTPTGPEVDDTFVETAVAGTLAAEQTESAVAQLPSEEPTFTSVPIPTLTPTSQPPLDVFAPDPLGAQFTGLIFDFNTCYDFDIYSPAPSGDPAVDICLDANGTLDPQNGATISGYVTFTPPSKNHCIGERLSPDLVAPNSDLYMCLQTNAGSYGFFVLREFQYQINRLIFDLYLFP